MWVVEVGQFRQQLGDVVAGIQGRQIAAKGIKALAEHRLGHEVERIGRLVQHHDIGNTEQVKATLEWRLQPPRPLAIAPTFPISRVKRVTTRLLSEKSTTRTTSPSDRTEGNGGTSLAG